MILGMIWAEARGGAIGRDGEMPWRLPEDAAFFKEQTLGAPVIMGRGTWESLPARFRPLPGRENFVVTSTASYDAPGATVVPSLESVLDELARDSGPHDRVWIMGGGQLYRAGMPFADELVVTRIGLDVPDADTFAPEIGPEWTLVDPGTPETSRTGLEYRFERWRMGASQGERPVA
ncbi:MULTISPECIES: dihydrofolate reductase [Leucobacter]|uniref:Dihydrofolate reductase n=2 Tax=Leucobacter TaxID=55968 RepID=A0ABN3B3N1_9MICO|nr:MULTISPECIES: dihydrofolate reductase [Leucobacter]